MLHYHNDWWRLVPYCLGLLPHGDIHPDLDFLFSQLCGRKVRGPCHKSLNGLWPHCPPQTWQSGLAAIQYSLPPTDGSGLSVVVDRSKHFYDGVHGAVSS